MKLFIEDTYFTKSDLQKSPPTKIQIIKLIQEKQYVSKNIYYKIIITKIVIVK